MIKQARIRFNDENVLYIAIDLETKEVMVGVADEKNGEFYDYTVTPREE